MTYSELVTRLRKRAKELPERFSKNEENIRLFLAAADAIEELSREYESVSKDLVESVELCRKLEKPNWIPVTKRFPNEYTRVIGYMAWKAMTAIEYQNGKWYSVDHLAPLPDKAVTHWMPLPKPPEEES